MVGIREQIAEPVQAMGRGGHPHGGPAALAPAPGRSGEVVVSCERSHALQIAGLVSSRQEAGMRGTVKVLR